MQALFSNKDFYLTIVILIAIPSAMVIKSGFDMFRLYEHYYYGLETKARIVNLTSKRVRTGKRWTYEYKYITDDGPMFGKASVFNGALTMDNVKYPLDSIVNISYLPHNPKRSILIRYREDLLGALFIMLTGILLMIRVFFTFVEWNTALNSLL